MRTELLLLLTFTACGLPYVAPRPFAEVPKPETRIEVCWLETAGVSAWGGFGAAGSVHADRWHATTSVLLIRHPSGDVLIDSGLSANPEEEAKALSAKGRFIFSQTASRNQPRGKLLELLAKANAEPAALKGVILSHAHADHAGGLTLLPQTPVWLPKEEVEFAKTSTDAVIPAHAKQIQARAEPIPFAPRAYAGFEQSWDVFRDGTLVVVPTFGHTPGSVATFVNLGTRRLVHVGDLINLQESIENERPKSWLMSTLTDEDRGATERQVAQLVRLQKHDPALWILPAHDRPAYEAFFGTLKADEHEPRCVTE